MGTNWSNDLYSNMQRQAERKRQQEQERKRQEEAQTYAQAVYGNKWREPMPKKDVRPAQPTTIPAALDGRSRPESARAAYKDIGGERRATAAKEGAPSEPMVRITAPRQERSVNASRRRSGNGNSLLPRATNSGRGLD